MTTLFLYLLYFAAATASPLQRRHLAVQRDGGGQIHFAFRVIAVMSVVGVVVLPFIHPFVLQGNIGRLLLLGLLCGMIGTVYWVCSYAAQRHVDAGVSTLAFNLSTPVAITLATFFLNERLTSLQLGGTVLLLIGLFLVSKKHRIGNFKFDRYFLMVLFAGAVLGVLFTLERALQLETGLSAGILLSWWSQTLCLGLTALVMKNHTTYTTKDALITGGVSSLQGMSWVTLMYVVGNLSLVSSISTFKVVLVFIAAAIFLKEREDLPRKIIGSLVAMLGLLLMK